ncbi:hypothetical protein C8R47DRAFT_1224282 [Mycena vitilis]|nr:hypothetical protein C8R47DRAFT_1224282 [Mycena vitilis]
MAPGHGKTLRRSSRERRRPPSPPSVVVKKPVRSANSVVNRKSSLANQTSSEESASESASETQDSSSSRVSFAGRRAASTSSDDLPLSRVVSSPMGKSRRKPDVDDDDVVMEEEDVGEASAPEVRETKKGSRGKRRSKVNLKLGEPPSKAPSKPKKLSQIAAERSESPVAPKAPPVGVNASEYIVTDLEECAAGVDLEWAKIKFPVSFDDSTVIPRVGPLRKFDTESACEYMRVLRIEHPDFIRSPGCTDVDFAHQGFLLMAPGCDLFPGGKSVRETLSRFNGFNIAFQCIRYRVPRILPPGPFPEDPSHPFFHDPDDPEPLELS